MDNKVIAEVLTTLLAFGIFFFFARKMFWGPITQAIEDRQARIQADYDRIEGLQRSVDNLKVEYDKRLQEIEAESREKIQEAIGQGRKMADEIAQQARAESEAAVSKSRQAMALEIEKARAELKQDVVRMTLAATEKMLRKNMDGNEQREQVNNFVAELARK